MRHPVVLSGHILTPTGLAETRLGFDPASGLITGVGDDLEGTITHDVGERVVVPGAIDLHVHFRDPGHPRKEDFASGTLAAMCGGVTTVFDMPNTDPATTSVAAYEAKRALVAPKAHVDWGLYGGVLRPGAELTALARVAPALKTYMGESTGCVTLEDIALLPRVFDDLADAGFSGLAAFHAEHRDIMAKAAEEHRDAPGLEGHGERRPVTAEAVAILALLDALDDHIARRGPPSFRVHVAHASTFHAHTELSRRPHVSFGVTPHHLLLDDACGLGGRARVNPPLRPIGHVAALWDAFTQGTVPILESDHAPHTATEKDVPVVNAPSGVPGVETMMPLMMARVPLGQLDLETLIAAAAERPADLMRLPKGRLEQGRHADLAVYDLERSAPIDPDRLHSRAGWTPFSGMLAVFPDDVWLRGQRIVADREAVGRPGYGQEVRRGVS